MVLYRQSPSPRPVRPAAQASTRVGGRRGSKQPSWQASKADRREAGDSRRTNCFLSASVRSFLSPMTDVCWFRPPLPGRPAASSDSSEPKPPGALPQPSFSACRACVLRRLAPACRGRPHVAHGSVRYRAAGQEPSWPPHSTGQWKTQGGLGVLQLKKNSFPRRFLSVFGLVSRDCRISTLPPKPPSGARPMMQSNG